MDSSFSNRAHLNQRIWLVIAIFFVLFYSCPVKKYIAICLGEGPATENTSFVGASYFGKELKICQIARNRVTTAVVTVVYQMPDDLPLPFIAGLFSTLLSFLGLLRLFKDGSAILYDRFSGTRSHQHRYLLLGKLQV